MDGKDLPITRTPRRAAPQKNNESESAINPPKFAFRLPPKFQISPTPHPVIVALGPELDPLVTRPTHSDPIRSKSLFQTIVLLQFLPLLTTWTSPFVPKRDPPQIVLCTALEVHVSVSSTSHSTAPIYTFFFQSSLSLYSNPQNPRQRLAIRRRERRNSAVLLAEA